MKDYVISASSTADLSAEHFEAMGVPIVHFHFTLDGKDYPDDQGKTIPFEKFYDLIDKGAMPTTSQVNVKEYVDHFEKLLQEAEGIIHLTLSSGISGSYNSAVIAGEQMREKYPEKKIYIIDSLAASSGFGLLVDAAARKKEEGLGIDELHTWIEENKLRIHHWFFSTDLKHYRRGGRISASSAALGTLLNICPLLNVDHLGRLTPRTKVRGKKKVIREIAKKMFDHAKDGENYSEKCFLSHSNCLEDAQAVAALVEEAFPHLDGKVLINSIGTVIGAHTGPGTVALFFFGEPRTE
jgi:DegV family protein with EDD domain